MGKLSEMLAGKGSVTSVVLPRSGTKVGVTCLTAQDLQDAQKGAMAECEANKVNILVPQGSRMYDQELATQLAARFLVDPDSPAVLLASNADEVRTTMTMEEVDQVVQVFYRHQDKVSPMLAELKPQEVTDLGEAPASSSSSAGSTPNGSRPSSAFQQES